MRPSKKQNVPRKSNFLSARRSRGAAGAKKQRWQRKLSDCRAERTRGKFTPRRGLFEGRRTLEMEDSLNITGSADTPGGKAAEYVYRHALYHVGVDAITFGSRAFVQRAVF
jgi:hypothetical protein